MIYRLFVGTYKPKFKCYDVHELCLKFERGLDAEVVNFKFLAEDYSKVCVICMNKH